jgi:hypothetical protein
VQHVGGTSAAKIYSWGTKIGCEFPRADSLSSAPIGGEKNSFNENSDWTPSPVARKIERDERLEATLCLMEIRATYACVVYDGVALSRSTAS